MASKQDPKPKIVESDGEGKTAPDSIAPVKRKWSGKGGAASRVHQESVETNGETSEPRPRPPKPPRMGEEGFVPKGWPAMKRHDAMVARHNRLVRAKLDKLPQVAEVTEDVPVTPEMQTFITAVLEAVDRTTEQEKRKLYSSLKAMTDKEYMSLLQSDIDFQSLTYRPSVIKQDFDTASTAFRMAMQHATGPQDLYDMTDAFINQELSFLFYESNDVMSARIRQSYVNAFLNDVLRDLQAKGLMDASWDEKFDTLRAAYQYGFDAYRGLKRDISDLSIDEDESLLAEAAQHMSGDPQDGTQKQRLKRAAIETMTDMLKRQYLLPLSKGEPNPLLLLLAQYSRTLAEIRIRAAEPTVDFDDVKQDSSEAFIDAYDAVCKPWLQDLQTNPSLATCVEHLNRLRALTIKEDRIPEEFGEVVLNAAAKAVDSVRDRTKDYYDKDRRERRNVTPNAAPMIADLLPNYTGPKHLQSDLKELAIELKRLGEATDKNSLCEHLNDLTTLMLDQTFFGTAHPALLLAAQDFIAELGNNLDEAMKAEGLHDDTFMRHLLEAQEMLGYAYKSRVSLGDWVMQETDLGSDNVFDSAWMAYGRHPHLIKTTEIKEVNDYARYYMKMLAQQRNIPKSMQQNPFAPVIYERCCDIAVAEFENKRVLSEQDIGGLSNKLKQHLRKQEAQENAATAPDGTPLKWRKRTGFRPRNFDGEILPPTQDEIEERRERLIARYDEQRNTHIAKRVDELMKQALARITPEPHAGEVLSEVQRELMERVPCPYFNAHNVKLLFDWLDAKEQELVPETRGRTH